MIGLYIILIASVVVFIILFVIEKIMFAESTASKEARIMIDRIDQRMEKLTEDSVDYWILSLMRDQLFPALDEPNDVSKSVSIMAQVVPIQMIKQKNKDGKVNIPKRYYELKKEIMTDSLC